MTRSETQFRDAVQGALRMARECPAFALYLLALAALGWKWLSPISSVHERAGWNDILIAAAAAAWLLECVRNRSFPRPRAFHLLLLAYIGIILVSAAFAEAQGTGARNLLLVTE